MIACCWTLTARCSLATRRSSAQRRHRRPPKLHLFHHQQRITQPGGGRSAPGGDGIRRPAGRHRHQRARRRGAAEGAATGRLASAGRRLRRAGRRGCQHRSAPGASVGRRPGRGRAGPLAAHRVAGSRRGRAGHPRRGGVGGRQRRPHAAVGAWTAAGRWIHGRGAAGERPTGTAGGREAGADTGDGSVVRRW